METTTWLDRQREGDCSGAVTGAGPALPLIPRAIMLIASSGEVAV